MEHKEEEKENQDGDRLFLPYYIKSGTCSDAHLSLAAKVTTANQD